MGDVVDILLPCIMGGVKLPHSIGNHPCNPSRWPTRMSLHRDLSTNPEAIELCVYVQLYMCFVVCVSVFHNIVKCVYSHRVCVSMI